MNIATPSASVVTPLKALWQWLLAAPESAKPSHNCIAAPASALLGRTNIPCKHAPKKQSHIAVTPRAVRPLRMLRVMEAGQTSSQVGRMVISGRMADVCAELDRLAASESCLH